MEYYGHHCEAAFVTFSNRHWICEYGEGKNACVNVRQAHSSKDHQNALGSITPGTYMCSFKPESAMAEWIQQVSSWLDQLQVDREHNFSIANSTLIEYTTKAHRTILQHFYSNAGGASRFKSHTSCFCCLRELPEHPLLCGHVFCTACVLSYARPHGHGTYEFWYCPLHSDDSLEPSLITLKPALAGVRVLCLDG